VLKNLQGEGSRIQEVSADFLLAQHQQSRRHSDFQQARPLWCCHVLRFDGVLTLLCRDVPSPASEATKGGVLST
jgi:hypothetical protein